MKKEILVLLIILFGLGNIKSQCLPDRHSATWYDGWISCETTENPNNVHGKTHWIMYQFDDIYYLYEMHVWNMNAPDLLDYDVKDVVIDISTDGTTWTEFGQFTFSQATGKNNFEGIEELNFQGTKAKYVLITPLTNYGGSCYALSEIKIRARDLCQSNIIAWKGGDGNWDVPTNWCGDQIPTATDSVWIPPNKNVTVPSAFNAQALWLDVDVNSNLQIDGVLNIYGN
ncbi:MAG TPA: hypothetical protein ENK91_17465 [Bacteroidetes bacterium]|nr:hypothetical protein [Bacteroidota bacterium]